MNALYRPGLLEYIPIFIRRKHGEEDIEYDFLHGRISWKKPMVLPFIKSK